MAPREEPGIDLARQVAAHLKSLSAAGVDWLPASPSRQEEPEAPMKKASKQQSQTLPLLPPAGATVDPNLSLAEREKQLADLRNQVAQCQRCAELAPARTQTVFGVGPLDPDICFVGEAPGADEDRLGEPFVGAAGQLLTRIIQAMGLTRQEVYICNILRCRPPGNRPPTPDEAGNCREWLEKTLALVRPKFICALGGSATTHLLGSTTAISKLRGQFLEYQGIPVLCTFHPSYLLRSPEKKKDVWEDMKLLLRRLGKEPPGDKEKKSN